MERELWFRVLVFQTVTILIMLYSSAGNLDLTCSHQPIIALAGDDVILPCHLEPVTSAASWTVKWTKPGLDPEFVHVHKDGRLLHEIQNPSYYYRTRLFVDELEHGNISMKIFKVKLSDEGTYRCSLPVIQEEVLVQLIVGSVSSPVVTMTNSTLGGVVLHCNSSGWHPEPEVLWLDGEGNLLSAGPTETVRGPDDLYTVSSRVTVEKRHSNSFTCRVQQNKTNQTRETHIHVPDDFFMTPSSSSLSTYIIVILFIVGIIISILAAASVWKWKQSKTKTETNQGASDASGKRENQSNSSEALPLTEGGEETERTRTENKSSHAESGPGRGEEERQTRDSVSSRGRNRNKAANGRGKNKT